MFFFQYFLTFLLGLCAASPAARMDEEKRDVVELDERCISCAAAGCTLIAVGIYMCLTDKSTSPVLYNVTAVDAESYSDETVQAFHEKLIADVPIEQLTNKVNTIVANTDVAVTDDSSLEKRACDRTCVGLCMIGVGAAMVCYGNL